MNDSLECICGSKSFEKVHVYTKKPEREVEYNFFGKQNYYRELYKCKFCGHYKNVFKGDINRFYENEYVNSTYKDVQGLKDHFNKIVNLPEFKSDNNKRINRVLNFCNESKNDPDFSILDIGSGLCVFLNGLKQKTKWKLNALDPDKRSCEHTRKNVNVDCYYGDFNTVYKELPKYNMVSLNRVLEHLQDPVKMLEKVKNILKNNGLVYLELPDGDNAFKESPLTEEFFIEHLHIFSAASFCILVEKAGFKLLQLNSCREPSGKYTLYGFIVM